jgi:Cft2 family RNA processing exonuclease
VQLSFQRGIHIPDSDLWLDPTLARARAVVSHAHADHVRRHAAIDATAATAAMLFERVSRAAEVAVHPYGDAFVRGGVNVTLFPAGHVLGSAQVLVESNGCRLLYSGDLRLRPSPAAEPVEVPKADVLVVDSTFGHSRYTFPPDEVVVAEILRFCERCFARGETPVLLAYALGKAQEAIMHLDRHGMRVAVDAGVARVNAVYREHGVALPDCMELASDLPRDVVAIVPPSARQSTAFKALRCARTAMLTGWAMDPGARYRMRVDAAFPLSDHCGFDDLLRYVELVGAREVHTVYGFADAFAAELRLRGIEAFPAGRAAQLALPGLL